MQATSRFPQASQRSPHTNSLRRGPGPIYAPPNAQHAQQPTGAQQQAALDEEKRLRDLKRRQARKPTDRNVPDELTDVVIGDGVDRYRKLREVERKLDAVMMQKRLDISESLTTQSKREGTLRIWISNKAEGQPWQVMDEGGAGEDNTFDFGDNSQATYRMRIEGRLLEDSEDQEEQAIKDIDAMETDQSPNRKRSAPLGKDRTKLSHFFRSISIDFDRAPSLQPDGYSSIVWKKPTPTNPSIPSSDAEVNFDCLEFERKGDEEMNVTVNLVRDEAPERYKLSKPLANLLDTEEEDRAGVVAGIWDYVRAMGLQEDDENRKIVCDEQLRQVFNMDTIFFPYIPDLINNHLTPLPPIALAYTIRVDKSYISPSSDSDTPAIPSAPTIYDITIPLPSPLKKRMQMIHASPTHLQNLKAITTIDDDLALLVQKIGHENQKRKFLDTLARDPSRAIQRWVSSQRRDLEIVLAEGGRGYGDEAPLSHGGFGMNEEFRRGGEDGVWGGDGVRQSVGLWLARQKH